MIRVLVVEDDDEFCESVCGLIDSLGFDTDITVKMSRSSAIEGLDDETFDYIILDQKIPTEDNALDADSVHGRAVLEHILSEKIGTPLIILTALSSDRHIPKFIRANRNLDIWGDGGEHPTIDFLRKADLDLLTDNMVKIFSAIYGLDTVDIGFFNGEVELNRLKKTLIRIFVKRQKGVRCLIGPLGGGMSGSDVFRVDVIDDKGSVIQNAVLKIGDRDMVSEEKDNFTMILRLNHVAAPHFLSEINYGAGRVAGVAFQLAKNFNRSLFDVLTDRDDVLPSLEKLSELFVPWDTASVEKRVLRIFSMCVLLYYPTITIRRYRQRYCP